ncbi:hypothetical protein [Deinococcus irradiatisoli]|uniref:hypothetical protein n=1 Tax=Deinococcus irradiatisoli TaxID=2202254 RepID=UPI0011B21202|nr:hypothetical protein [Deinococcus irradiatisoli]
MPFHPLDQDQPNVMMRCRNCQTSWLVYQQQVGLPLPCPSCGAVALPYYQGTVGRAGTGRQVSYGSFKQLLSSPNTSAAFTRLIEHLTDLRHEGDLRFVDAAGHEVNLAEVHYRIQSQVSSQDMLYNRYMDIVH